MIIPKDELKPKGLKGISDKQIEYHFETHYKGYINKLNEILEKQKIVDRTKANQNYSEYRALKVEESFNYEGVLLHEFYFENLKDNANTKPSGKLIEYLQSSFGSLEKWKEDFKACGTTLRGWAVLVHDPSNKILINNGLDAHNVFGLLGTTPLLVLDVYEHAYYVDYKNDRGKFVEAFWNLVNWNEVSKRLDAALK